MKRKLFCEYSPLTYRIAVKKNIIARHIKDFFEFKKFATKKTDERLPIVIYQHKSLIRRVLGNVDMTLQENKAVNLSIAAPKVNGVLIRPGEVFSFWKLVGKITPLKGYKEGLTISNAKVASGTGGGMCQFTNLIHWMVLHSPLEIIEHHHHDGFDLFPDYNRQIPFGTGTSIMYNYLDYRVKNNTNNTYQLVTYVTDTYLCGELRATQELDVKYHVSADNECFVRENGVVYRTGFVYLKCFDKRTGNLLKQECIRQNHAKVMYDTDGLDIIDKN
ncbi:MAG: vancomycin resistance protein [Ruminococcaceae bacterium]|nr:vancomycin resistance protein [Oscillospiraceae bacterium]